VWPIEGIGIAMSNHFSAAYLKFPGDDARLDLTDLYAFPASGDTGRTVLIIDVNPFTTGLSATPPFLMSAELHPDAVYRINIDNDGDNQADAAFSFAFTEASGGGQTGTAFYATGADARSAEPRGEVLARAVPVGFDASARPVRAGRCRLFTGVRSDPPCTASSGRDRTPSPARTCSPSRWRCPTTCSARNR
jgi:hypothetical protein